MKQDLFLKGCVFALALGLASATQAALIVETGNQCSATQPGSGCVENVLFNGLPAGFDTDPGNPVFGRLNMSSELVKFSSNELLTTPSGGQARVEDEAGDGLSQLMIEMNDPTRVMEVLQFNINALGNTTANLALEDQLGAVTNVLLTLSGNGQNRYSVYGTAGDVIVSAALTIVGAAGIDDVRQVRIGAADLPTTGVPEPATLGLFGLGLLALRATRRKSA